MFDLATLFSSKARLKVLRTLYHQSTPLPLRHIAYLSDTPVFSVQRAVKQLTTEKILLRKKSRLLTLYSLNSRNMLYPFLTEVFNLEMKKQVAFLSKSYARKAISVLNFSSSAQHFLKDVKSWT